MTAGAIIVPTIVPLRAPQPGKPKNQIDTETKIELHTRTPSTEIYYTINGTKPDPFQPIGSGQRVTMKYKGPFHLPEGKRTVKAIAVSSDGVRESGIVTKVFEVEFVPQVMPPASDGDDSEHFVDDVDHEFDTRNTTGIGFSARNASKSLISKILQETGGWKEGNQMRKTNQMMSDMNISGSTRHNPPDSTRFMNARLGSISGRARMGHGSVGQETVMAANTLPITNAYARPPQTSTQSMRLQRETDFLKCVYCLKPRPADPFARFCLECGNPVPPLPQTRLPPPEAGQMGMCIHCRSVVPFNTSQCLVCESPIPPQHQPQASIRLQDKSLCIMCGTQNPANIMTCITCEARLPANAKPIYSGLSAPPLPSQDGHLRKCTKCSRVNNSDARFCDWCGAKPAPRTSSLICSKCTASNQPYATFCGSCGILLEPPARIDPRNSGITHNLSNDGYKTTHSAWLPVSYPLPEKIHSTETKTVTTQTVGLFYPSEREIIRRREEEEDRYAMQKEARDRKPLITAVSPGRGYWRKQMEHITSHLKAHVANNAEFRALIGEPRMGKLISASVHEDGYEMSLTANFALKGNKDPFTGKNLDISRGHMLSTHTEGRRGSLDSYPSMDSLATDRTDQSSASVTRKTKKKKVVKKAKKKKEDDRTPEDKKLIREVGKNGEGRISEIEALIDEGADPNCVNNSGMPCLSVAALNKRIDAISVLAQAGAEIDKKGPNKGNTALHEAVSLGHAGRDVIDALLGCGANPRKKNDKEETPYDLAAKAGYDSIANKLASSLGQSQLDKMIRPKSSTRMDAF